jgi:hypothetical protein
VPEQQRPQPAARAAAPGAAVLRLQASAGNQAVAQMLNRSEAATASAPQPATAAPAAASERSWWQSALDKVASSAREKLLGPLTGIARKVPGYDLLALALGRDPISGQTVERSGMAVVRGVAGLIPGGAAVLANLEQSGALQRAGAWLSAEIPKLGLTWEAIGGLFSRAFSALKASDILNPAAAWERLAGIFAPPLARLRDFGVAGLIKLREFVFEGALAMAGGAAAPIMAVLRRGGAVLDQIFANPVGFAGNLMSAVRGGLERFAGNIGTHLKTGLFGWLFGALRGVIELPKRFDLAGIGSMVLQVLGLTWGRLRERLVGRVGAPRVAFLERTVDFVQRIATDGLGAVWGKVVEFASGLTETVVGAIREWVMNSIVGAAITRLVTMFNPVGALIQAVLSIYRAIQWLMQKAEQLRSLAASIFDSIAAIASGSLGGAITAVENALARTLPVVISFLATQLGLGNITDHIRGVIDKIRGTVDRAIGKVVDWVVKRFRGSRGAETAGAATGQSATTPGAERVKAEALQSVRSRFQQKPATTYAEYRAVLASVLTELRPRGLKRLSAKVDAETLDIQLSAHASPPTTITIRPKDVFDRKALRTAEVRDVLQRLEGVGKYEDSPETHAALVVDGKVCASEQNARKHAEIEVLQTDGWIKELTAAKGKRRTVTLLINRSPCPKCAAYLVGWMRNKEERHPEIDFANVEFVLAPTGSYAPGVSRDITEQFYHLMDERGLIFKSRPPLEVMEAELQRLVKTSGLSQDATSLQDLRDLAGAGWQLRQFQIPKGAATDSGAHLARRIDVIRREVAKAKAPLEESSAIG